MVKKLCKQAAFFLSFAYLADPACATSQAASTSLSVVPESVRTLLAPTDTVLAFKQTDSLDGIGMGAALVVRHTSSGSASDNPCELIVLQSKSTGYVISSRSDKAVDCINIGFPKRAREMDLNDNLTVKPREIAYFNERERGGQTYVFAYSTKRSAWHLKHASSVHTQPGESKVDVIELTADYPADFGWVPMSSFDPRLIADALAKHRMIH